MKQRYFVLYSCSGDIEEISYFQIFRDKEYLEEDLELFLENTPSGKFFSVPFFVSDDDFEKLDYYIRMYHDNL